MVVLSSAFGPIEAITRSIAWVACDHVVVSLSGRTGGYDLEFVHADLGRAPEVAGDAARNLAAAYLPEGVP